MMFLDFSKLEARDAYFWMASTITPRPVAWVSTLSSQGVSNLAPFSFFQMITASPPTLMISPLKNGDGSMKDTPRNIEQTRQFVVNLVAYPMVKLMNETSFGFDPGLSEFEQCGISSLPSELVKPPRVKDAIVSFECELAQFMPYPAESPSCFVILGRVVAAHIDERIVGEDKKVDPIKLDLVSRMGADWYGRTNAVENFELVRPKGWAR
ncbi:MAG: flavin reductase family protein [Burkholderiaceae bacterium]|jgi:flavin reductase (DIM6/NTAB) family NADH-FMN oxidoreductase RutF